MTKEFKNKNEYEFWCDACFAQLNGGAKDPQLVIKNADVLLAEVKNRVPDAPLDRKR